jgi:hypothetical protein
MRSALHFLLIPALVAAQTQCQQCCAPGGDCSKAYKGGPGMCCGEVAGNSFCCPTRSNDMGAAKCWACNNAFRCYAGSRPSPNICATEGGTNGINPSSSSRRGMGNEGNDIVGIIIIIVSFLAIAMAVSACARHRRQMPLTMTPQGTAGMQMQTVVGKPGQPMGAVQPGMPMGTAMPMQGGCYPAAYGGYPHTGYGGGTVAASAGMGFLGGMMVGEMMSDHGHGYGGDYGGGGGGYGGDMGGGDMGGDFSADM